jgi:DNA-binding transcriptional LysR family regulator
MLEPSPDDATEGDVEVDLTRLKYFVAVAEELHFKRAADRLHITPPPLSKQIKVLERELGGALFERDYHQVRLTALGEALVGPARRTLAEAADFKATAAHLTQGPRPLLIGATAYAPSDILQGFEDAVGRLHAARTVFSIPGSAVDVTAQLVAGQLDLGLIYLPPTDSRVDYRVVAHHPSGIAVRSDDPLATRASVAIEDLHDRDVAVDLSGPNPTLQAGLIRRLKARGVSRVVTASARGSEIEVATQARTRHLAVLVAYTSGSTISRLFSPPDFTLIPFDDSWELGKLALAWCTGRAREHPALVATIDELTDLLGEP